MKLVPAVSTSIAALLLAASAFAQGTPNQPPPLPPPNNPPPPQPAQPAPAQPAPGPAQPAPAQPAPAQHSAEAASEGDGPPAQTGFQMALRTGVMIPFGDAAKNTSMSDVVGPQVPIIVELGGKPIPNLFIGGFLGFGFGGAAGKLADACTNANAGCVAVSFQLGVEVQYHISPGEKINPWVGYGLGIGSVAVGGSVNGQDFSSAAGGFDFAHLMGGLDFRLNKTIGLGPLVDFTAGTYSTTTTKQGGRTTDRDIDSADRTTHFWLLLGGRLVFFP